MGSTPGTDAAGHPQGSLTNPEVAHETSDIDVRAILWFIVILVVTVILIDVSIWVLFKGFTRLEVKNDPPVTPLMAPAGQLPPEPVLQLTPWKDLEKLRADEQQYLHSYGWIDEKAGVAHLPINKAKALLLQRGLPTRPAAAAATEGTHVAATGESSSGRTITAESAKPPGGER
jgi:hypothetical protein